MEQERRTEGRKHKSVKKQGRGEVRKSVKDRGTRETDGQTKETDGKTRETDVRGWGMRERERKRGTRERGRERENGERMERGGAVIGCGTVAVGGCRGWKDGFSKMF